MWGDYHLLEAALYVERIARSQPDYTFFGALADALTKRRTTPRFKNVIREGKAPAELRITAHPARQEPRPPGFEIRSDVADRWIPYPKPTPTKRL